jgi:flagellar biosynthesis protein FlhB
VAERPAAERTEHPTPKTLSKAKTEGQTPQSQELLSFISIVILMAAVAFLAPGLMRWCTHNCSRG